MPGLIDSLLTTDALDAAFSDAAVLQGMVAFEVALAAVESDLGIIPADAASAIASAAATASFDPVQIARAARASATPSIAFVQAFAVQVRREHADAAGFVHWGATSQDVFDTAVALCLKQARVILAGDHARLLRALLALSDAHATTVMLGRTLLQPAAPITFGLKVAGWAAAVARAWADVCAALDAVDVLPFGGAVGTLAAVGPHALEAREALAGRLGLRSAAAPCHAARDRQAHVVSAFGVYAGCLGKLATDIALLMQHEVGEVAERGGGSSTMPHKQNPSGCAIILASAARLVGLTATALTNMPQEHERAVGGWQGEAATLRDAATATGSALHAAVDVVEGLSVFPDRMRRNLDATGGAVFAERAVFLLAPHVGKDTAARWVAEAVGSSREIGRPFREVLASHPDVARALTSEILATLDAPELYLGSAEAFRCRLIADVTASQSQ